MSYIYKTGRIELYEQIKRHANFIKGRVLDVGASNFPRYKGLFNFDEYVTMDIEPKKGVDKVGRIEAIPFPDNTFDSIVCTQVLGDVYDLHKAFEEMHRVLKLNGVALITESLFDPLHDEPRDFWRFTKHSLRRLAEDADFKIEVLEHRGGYHSIMAQLRARYWIELSGANKKWFARLLSLLFKIFGTWARLLDRMDNSRANKLFTHGYILICSK
ncbi:MAG: methyltransferase domain-containing protein [Candidatus Zambryskibacteria bacterium]|nr:methyltransferase domain-containing protein [Candidatus Zambryskibacteria bacterium]